ncbi:MAG TPA: hypothetical protein VK164_03200 [Flavobacterium sp.]|uniref:hypothetical protein n=1 Tax=Flavobacterium sp. TaxID=239 RepID=UPI002B4B50B2|nr:hypothetical protein [Flavobacterium sp.]HLO72919.1 hypothetical protein [Flavobacterium sp.]
MKGLNLAELPKNPETSHKIIDNTFEEIKMTRELGFLGQFFGSGNSIKLNIAGLFIFILVLIGIIYTSCVLFATNINPKAIGILDFWGIITPLITLALGYIFGKKE